MRGGIGKIKKRLLKFVITLIILLGVFLPGFSKLQEIRSKNERLDQEIARLKEENQFLKEKIDRLDKDSVYLESIAREKMGLVRKGEIVYRIVPEE